MTTQTTASQTSTRTTTATTTTSAGRRCGLSEKPHLSMGIGLRWRETTILSYWPHDASWLIGVRSSMMLLWPHDQHAGRASKETLCGCDRVSRPAPLPRSCAQGPGPGRLEKATAVQ
eukprot:4175413-Pyramimonas_sp.AAC.1